MWGSKPSGVLRVAARGGYQWVGPLILLQHMSWGGLIKVINPHKNWADGSELQR